METPKGLYPGAIFFKELPEMKCLYDFGAWPEVFVVHFTAGWQNQKGEDFVKSFVEKGFCCDFMDEKGQVFQQRHGNRGGYHAGKSLFMGRHSVSRFAPGLEIACGGKLVQRGDKLFTWFNKEVDKDKARFVTREMGYVAPGWYEIMTQEQEESLANFLAWQMKKGVKYIVGHDEIAPDRKSDPGGSLSLPLYKFVDEKVLPIFKTL